MDKVVNESNEFSVVYFNCNDCFIISIFFYVEVFNNDKNFYRNNFLMIFIVIFDFD